MHPVGARELAPGNSGQRFYFRGRKQSDQRPGSVINKFSSVGGADYCGGRLRSAARAVWYRRACVFVHSPARSVQIVRGVSLGDPRPGTTWCLIWGLLYFCLLALEEARKGNGDMTMTQAILNHVNFEVNRNHSQIIESSN